MDYRMLAAMADTFNYEYQSRSSEESGEVLASLALRMADCIEDPVQRTAFLEIASMSGLATEERHKGHFSRLGGAWYCDTCDSPYCDLA